LNINIHSAIDIHSAMGSVPGNTHYNDHESPLKPDQQLSRRALTFEPLKHFCTGAMSLGALSREAHKTLAITVNRVGGKPHARGLEATTPLKMSRRLQFFLDFLGQTSEATSTGGEDDTVSFLTAFTITYTDCVTEPFDHTSTNAILTFPTECEYFHGAKLQCSYPSCQKDGVKFRYCKPCNKAVGRRHFGTKHSHPELLLVEEMEETEDILMPSTALVLYCNATNMPFDHTSTKAILPFLIGC